jgi:hypothetical protein
VVPQYIEGYFEVMWTIQFCYFLLAEGTVGYNTAKRNMENLQSAGVDENYYKDGRVAFFAKGYTDFVGAEVIYDINKNWDLGLQSSILHSWNAGQLDYCEGISVGYNVMQNAWASLGCNLTGFDDNDFSHTIKNISDSKRHSCYNFIKKGVCLPKLIRDHGILKKIISNR